MKDDFLECEKWYCFLLLIMVGGYFGAYTYVLKGGVFCNAQTANILIFAMSLGSLDFSKALNLLIPISAYFIGTMVSEYLALDIKRYNKLRWDTFLIGIEIVTVIILSLLPNSVPNQVFQVTINFICAMQFNTFRQAEKIPMATTFVTNHVRQTGSFFVRWLRKKEEIGYLIRSFKHLAMILGFIVGAMLSTVACYCFGNKAILGALVFLVILFVNLLYADLVKEKDLLHRVPNGH